MFYFPNKLKHPNIPVFIDTGRHKQKKEKRRRIRPVRFKKTPSVYLQSPKTTTTSFFFFLRSIQTPEVLPFVLNDHWRWSSIRRDQEAPTVFIDQTSTQTFPPFVYFIEIRQEPESFTLISTDDGV